MFTLAHSGHLTRHVPPKLAETTAKFSNARAEQISDIDRAIITVSNLALNCRSTFTIAWSKEEHKEELILHAGIGTSAVTVLGAI